MNQRKPPCSRAVQIKLSRLVSQHEQLKIAFNHLNSQIRSGLLEAEDVFASLAVPLMNLVGLKTEQMASEGRFTTVFTSVDQSPPQDEYYVIGALSSGNELIERQRCQLMQLVKLLKSIEAQVNSSQNSIFQSLAYHQKFIQKFFMKAFTYVSDIHQSNQSNELSLVMLKLLKATFDQVGAVLGSVEVGVDDMIRTLAEEMCIPMVEYVNVLKVEMKTGTCSRLLEVIKEMDGAMRVGRFELEEARKRAKLAEQGRMETLSKLRESEETSRKLTISLGLLTNDTVEPEETAIEQQVSQQKSSLVKEDQAKDDSLMWELLKKKRKCHIPDSPLGPNGLLGIQTRDKRLTLTRTTPTYNLRSKRSQTRGVEQFLGASPSATIQKVLRRRRVTP